MDALTPQPRTAALLAWYDRHRRVLPWRALPGERAEPYRVWVSEIMLQQTTIAAVKPYFERFMARFPTVEALSAAPSESVMQAWAGLGYYSRARNLHACAKALVALHGGRFPGTEDGLRALPGIGAYTAGALAAIAFDQPTVAVDGNVERVLTRLFAIDEALPAAKPLIREKTLALLPRSRPGDFAQALMDLGATICTPRAPACAICPWQKPCRARAAGTQETYPRKTRKKAGVTRYGAAFVAMREDGAVLVRTRPAKGLLGGMVEVPTSDWRADYRSDSAGDAPVPAQWRRLNAPVRHVFTHFPLELMVFAGRVPLETLAPEGMRFTPIIRLREEAFPTVFLKALEAGLEALRPPPSVP